MAIFIINELNKGTFKFIVTKINHANRFENKPKIYKSNRKCDSWNCE